MTSPKGRQFIWAGVFVVCSLLFVISIKRYDVPSGLLSHPNSSGPSWSLTLAGLNAASVLHSVQLTEDQTCSPWPCGPLVTFSRCLLITVANSWLRKYGPLTAESLFCLHYALKNRSVTLQDEGTALSNSTCA